MKIFTLNRAVTEGTKEAADRIVLRLRALSPQRSITREIVLQSALDRGLVEIGESLALPYEIKNFRLPYEIENFNLPAKK